MFLLFFCFSVDKFVYLFGIFASNVSYECVIGKNFNGIGVVRVGGFGCDGNDVLV